MKKNLAIVLTLMMILSLAACGKKTVDNPSPEPNPPITTPSVSTPSNDDMPDVIVPEYSDDDILVTLDGEDVVFIGNASMEWVVDEVGEGVTMTQNAETIVLTPIADIESTTTITCPDVVMYFVTVSKQPASDPTVFVEKLELGDIPQPSNSTSYDDIDEMIETIYSTIPEELMPMSLQSSALPTNDEATCEYVLGVGSLDGLEYAGVSEPMMTSSAYSLVVLKFDTNENAEKAVPILKENAPINKWICVQADAVGVNVVKDTYVVFVMGSVETVNEIENVTFD